MEANIPLRPESEWPVVPELGRPRKKAELVREINAALARHFPGVDWEQQAAYFFQRVIEHGRRRAEEMREAAQTVREAGLAPWSAEGTAERQAWVAGLAEAGVFGARNADWRVAADRVLAQLEEGAR